MVNEFRGQVIDKEKASIGCFPGIYRFYVTTDEADVNRLRSGYVLAETVIPVPPDGTSVILKGRWDDLKFEVSEIKIDTSSQELSLILVKGAIEKVKEKYKGFKIANTLPKKIVKAVGGDVVKYIGGHTTERDLIASLPKEGPETLGLIYTELKIIVGSLTVFPYFKELKISSWKANKLVERYGSQAVKKLKKHPFTVGMDCGLNFVDCDKIAYSEGHDQYGKERITAAAIDGLNTFFNSSGSTYCSMDDLYKAVVRMLKAGSYPYEKIAQPVVPVMISGNRKFETFENEGTLYITLKYMRDQERSIVKNIKRLSHYKKHQEYSDSYISLIERQLGIAYQDEQKEAIQRTKEQGLFILTGGPGTGKTTTLAGIIELYKMMGKKDITLCAPTGRAAQRMKEATGMEASTIHRLLGIKPYENKAEKDASNPIETDLLIVDEFSMVDTQVCALLFDAVKNDTTMILVGDEGQLRSVGPGNVLHDFLKSGRIKTMRLVKTMRQAKGCSSIIENAKRIREGNYNLMEDESFKVITCENIIEARKIALELFDEEYDETNPFKIQFMSPVKKNIIGVSSLNESIKENYNPAPGQPHGKFRRGDRVIFTRNNAFENYYNGDLGIVKDCTPGFARIQVGDNVIELSGLNLEDVMLSYFITIHKSQGSEFDECIIVLPQEPKILLTRNLLNTAITRAKKKITVIQVGNAMKEALNRNPVKVYTGLSLMLGDSNG